MSFSVNTNTNALAALETLNLTQQAQTKTQNRVSTGLKVASAADDASTFAIAQGQRGDIAGFQAISNSLALGSAAINVALQGAQTISDTLNSIKAKVVAAQDPTQDHNAIQNDIKAFIDQINSTAAAAQFNGVNLVNGGGGTADILSSLNRTGSSVSAATITIAAQDLSASGTALNLSGLNVANQSLQVTFTANFASAETLAITVGSGASAVTTTFEFITASTAALSDASHIAVVIGATSGATIANLNAAAGAHGFSANYDTSGNIVISSGSGDVTAVSDSGSAINSGATATVGAASSGANALNLVENAINAVKKSLSVLGTAQNQLQTQTNFVKTLTDALTSGVGQLVDADLAAESANLQALQTKQQLGIQALSIANQGPGAILSLFR